MGGSFELDEARAVGSEAAAMTHRARAGDTLEGNALRRLTAIRHGEPTLGGTHLSLQRVLNPLLVYSLAKGARVYPNPIVEEHR